MATRFVRRRCGGTHPLLHGARNEPVCPARVRPCQSKSSSSRAARDFLPSFAHYRAIGIQSLDRLDDLLAQQAQKAPHSLPCPTAGTLDFADLPD